jgi:hypothetical protein
VLRHLDRAAHLIAAASAALTGRGVACNIARMRACRPASGPVFVLLLAAALTLPSAGAQATYYTLKEWIALPRAEREIYLAGAYDSLIAVGAGGEAARVALHYRSCVARARLTLRDLTAGVAAHARKHPFEVTVPVQTALVRYLIARCGKAGDA